MLVNKYKESKIKPPIKEIALGDYYSNDVVDDADILIILDANGDLKMLNAHRFMIIYDKLDEEGIINNLNEFNYKLVKAKIVAG